MTTLDPPAELWIDLSHGRTRVRVAGPEDGRPVLLVHGMTYPLEVWDPLSRDLAQAGYRVARYDLYGRGESDWDGEPLSMDTLSGQIIDLLEELGWSSRVPLVSLSNSDLVLLTAARASPDRFQSLSLIAPSGFDRRLMNPRIRWLSRLPGSTIWLGPRLRSRCIQRMKEHQSCLTSEMDDEVGYVYGRSRYWAATNPYFAGAVCSQIRELPSDAVVHDDLEAVATTEIPISVLRFGAEEDSTDDGLSPFLNGMPKARIEQLESGSHMGLLEHTGDVNSWVRSTLC